MGVSYPKPKSKSCQETENTDSVHNIPNIGDIPNDHIRDRSTIPAQLTELFQSHANDIKDQAIFDKMRAVTVSFHQKIAETSDQQ